MTNIFFPSQKMSESVKDAALRASPLPMKSGRPTGIVFNPKPHHLVQHKVDVNDIHLEAQFKTCLSCVCGEIDPNRAKCLLWVVFLCCVLFLSLGGCGSSD